MQWKRCSDNNDCQCNNDYQFSPLKDNKQDYQQDQDTSTSSGSFFYDQGIYDLVIGDKNIFAKKLPKAIIGKFSKMILISTLMDDIWKADFADMELGLR